MEKKRENPIKCQATIYKQKPWVGKYWVEQSWKGMEKCKDWVKQGWKEIGEV